MAHNFRNEREAYEAGYRLPGLDDKDVSGPNSYGYTYEDEDGNRTVDVWLGDVRNMAGGMGAILPMFPPVEEPDDSLDAKLDTNIDDEVKASLKSAIDSNLAVIKDNGTVVLKPPSDPDKMSNNEWVDALRDASILGAKLRAAGCKVIW